MFVFLPKKIDGLNDVESQLSSGTLKDERVILTRDQFKKLLNQMKPPLSTIIQPPSDYLLSKAVYEVIVCLMSFYISIR